MSDQMMTRVTHCPLTCWRIFFMIDWVLHPPAALAGLPTGRPTSDYGVTTSSVSIMILPKNPGIGFSGGWALTTPVRSAAR